MMPFLTLYTPTYRRPQGLARNLASVQAQTAVADIEQIVIPDHVGVGIGGMFSRVQHYADAVHGQYVMFLCDDDLLASTDAVSQLRDIAQAQSFPELLIVQARKGGATWPAPPAWPPRMGYIDLNCLVVRSDIWKRHVGQYGDRYEGDFDFAHALWSAGVSAVSVDLLVSSGGVSRGAAERADDFVAVPV